MAAKTLDHIEINPNGSIHAVFSDGTGNLFSSREDLINSPIVAGVGTDDWMTGLMMARWLALDPDLNDPSVINGTTLEVILASVNNPITYEQN